MQTLLTIFAIFFLQFADKASSESVCLSPLAQQMRQERNIEIDSLDYAVSPIYLDSIKTFGAKVLHTSRWLNGATIEASEQMIQAIQACHFVQTVYLTKTDIEVPSDMSLSLQKRLVATTEDNPTGKDQTTTSNQLNMLHLTELHQNGYRGKGIRIGVADGGFYNADNLAYLPHEQWIGWADFTGEADDFFGPSGNHGALCLSAIVAKQTTYDGTADTINRYEGAAVEAEYFLLRTEEHASESPKEIDNWVAALEMADSLGLHIVSTSLGYTTFDYEPFNFSYSDMNGRTSRGAQAAKIAARKGMLLVVAVGNDGNKAWKYLSTPADADSILTIGAVDTAGIIADFSSYGPGADGRVKPEVCAVGKATALIDPATNAVISGNGTSFACPLIAGMAACLWSALPEASNMEIRERIIRSADRYDEPHEQYGYGIPNAWLAYTGDATSFTPTPLPPAPYTKIIQNGQLYIRHQGVLYNLLGNKIE